MHLQTITSRKRENNEIKLKKLKEGMKRPAVMVLIHLGCPGETTVRVVSGGLRAFSANTDYTFKVCFSHLRS